MESVPSYALSIEPLRESIMVGQRAMTAVKGGIEAGDLRKAGAAREQRSNGRQVIGLVERRQRNIALKLRYDVGVQQHWLVVVRPAVDHSMTDRSDLDLANGPESLDRPHALIHADEMHLEARRSGVDDENGRQRSVGPDPVADLGIVLAVHAGVGASLESTIDHFLAEVGRVGSDTRNAIDHVDDEVIAIEVVQHGHVNGVVVVPSSL